MRPSLPPERKAAAPARRALCPALQEFAQGQPRRVRLAAAAVAQFEAVARPAVRTADEVGKRQIEDLVPALQARLRSRAVRAELGDGEGAMALVHPDPAQPV